MTDATLTAALPAPLECIPALAGFKVNWEGYSPAFGKEWHDKLINCLLVSVSGERQNMRSMLTDAERSISCYENAHTALKRCEEELRKAVASAGEAGFSAADIERVNASHAGLEAVLANLSANEGRAIGLAAKRDALKSDIAFLDEYSALFMVDDLLDRQMFASTQIPIKYRTKLFRDNYRLLREQNERIAKIKASKSAVKEVMFHRIKELEQAFVMLCQAYKSLLKTYKVMKTALEKNPTDFWTHQDSFLFHADATHRDLEAEATAMFLKEEP